MAPVTPDAVIRCKKQTSDLFDAFMRLNFNHEDFLPKQQHSREYRDIHHSRSSLQRDSPLKSGNESSPIFSRSPGSDAQSINEQLQREKRLSQEIKKRYSYGSTPPMSSSPQLCLQRDSVAMVPMHLGDTNLVAQGSRSEKEEVECKKRRSIAKIDSVERPEYEEFPDERSRSYSFGPTEEQIRDAALTIAQVGDSIEKEYGSRLGTVETQLSAFVSKAGASLTYEVFAAHVNDLVDHDRNWRNFMFVMHLSRRVITTTHSVGTSTADYFRRFVGDAFAEQVATQHDVVRFVQSNAPTKHE